MLLGLAPLVATAWLLKLSRTAAQITGFGTAVILLAVIGLGWIGWRPLLRVVEINFWSLNALAIQPGYAFREGLRYLTESMLGTDTSAATRGRLRAISSAAAAIILCIVGVLIAAAIWPASRWVGTAADLLDVRALILPTLANAVVVVCAYLAVVSLIWGFADALMDQPTDLGAFDKASGGPTWRIAHLSDIHTGRRPLRLSSGRTRRRGPRGNGRFTRILARIEAIHHISPLDIVLISGDMTNAGLATEWAEFLDAVEQHPALAERMIILPGNHDLNIVDRLNPARLDLPFSPIKRLRQMRTLSAMAAIQGQRVLVVNPNWGNSAAPLGKRWRRSDSGSRRLPTPAACCWRGALDICGTISFR